jgi:hypothetical protein
MRKSLTGPLRHLVGLAALLAAGCGSAPTTAPAATGAAEKVTAYYEALVRQDWNAAYACLYPESRRRWRPEQFAKLARAYRQGLGFEPEEVRLRSCQEQGDEAVAQVVLRGRAKGRERSFRDAILLRRQNQTWGIVLPRRFGQGQRK